MAFETELVLGHLVWIGEQRECGQSSYDGEKGLEGGRVFQFTPFLPPPLSDETDGENQTPRRRRPRLTHAQGGSPLHPQPPVRVRRLHSKFGGEPGRVADRGEHGRVLLSRSRLLRGRPEVDNPVGKLMLDGVHPRGARDHATAQRSRTPGPDTQLRKARGDAGHTIELGPNHDSDFKDSS